MKLRIIGLKEGRTSINVRGSTDGGEEITKSFPIIVEPRVEVYNPGISSYDELVEGSFITNIANSFMDEKYFAPCSFSEDGTLTISGMDSTNNMNGVYTPEPGKWKNSNLEPIRYTGNNGINLILRYGKTEVFHKLRADIYGWDIQVINNLKWSGRSVEPSFAGMHFNILTKASLRWCSNFEESTPDSIKPFRPVNYNLYYTQEIKDSQGDDSFQTLLVLNDFTKTFVPHPNGVSTITFLYFEPTEEQKAWNVEFRVYYYGSFCFRFPNMSLVPKGKYLIEFTESPSNGNPKTLYRLVLHKEI